MMLFLDIKNFLYIKEQHIYADFCGICVSITIFNIQ